MVPVHFRFELVECRMLLSGSGFYHSLISRCAVWFMLHGRPRSTGVSHFLNFMISYCQHMYHSLSEELLRHQQAHHSFQREVEACFGSCYHYWSLVAEKMAAYSFTSLDEEILFFRTIKPLFVALIEYYQFLYHSLLFQPESKPALLAVFWEREASRLPVFIARHESFYHYYKDGCTHRDEEFFTRRPDPLHPNEPCSSCDHLVSRLLALQHYDDYANKKRASL